MLSVIALNFEVIFIKSQFLKLCVNGFLICRGDNWIIKTTYHDHRPLTGLEIIESVD